MAMTCQQESSAQSQAGQRQPESPAAATSGYQDQSLHDRDKDSDRPRDWHKFVTWPESWTAWAIIATLLAIAYQSYWTRRATEEIARHERPWLLIEGISFDEPGTTAANNGKFANEAFHYTLKNYGRTPARILALSSRVDIGESSDFPPHPEVYALKDFAVNPHIIPQRDYREHHTPLALPVSDQQLLFILSGELFLWACAIVRYEDVHGNRYETRVCYRNDSDANKISVLRLDGPAGYNKTT